MQAGDLRDRVGFYQRSLASDGAGNSETAYGETPEFTTAAQIRPKLGGETVQAGRLSGQNYVNITVRQSSHTRRIDPAWKARDERRGVDYNIRSIIDPKQDGVERSAWLELLCEVGVAS